LRLSHVGVIRIKRQDGCLLTVAARVTRVVEHVNKLGDAFSRSTRVRESRIYRAHMPPCIKNHAINHAIERSWPRVITLCHEIIHSAGELCKRPRNYWKLNIEWHYIII